MNGGERAVAIAREYLGRKEHPPGSNKVEFSDWYGMNDRWCAMFLSFVWFNRMELVVPSDATTRKGWAFTPYMLGWGRRHGLMVEPAAAQMGDVVLYNWAGGNEVDHVELVVSTDPAKKRITSIGGNTGGQSLSNGGMVLEHSFLWSAVGGIWRPNFYEEDDVTPADIEAVANSVVAKLMNFPLPASGGQHYHSIVSDTHRAARDAPGSTVHFKLPVDGQLQDAWTIDVDTRLRVIQLQKAVSDLAAAVARNDVPPAPGG